MADNFYITGGTLPQDANSYVVRRADTDLLDGLRSGEFCYVLNTRQMGKSSLMVRAARQLRLEGWRVAILDLTAIGANLTVEQWYFGLLNRVAAQLGDSVDVAAFWKRHREMGPMQRFVEGLYHILTAKEEGETRKEEEVSSSSSFLPPPSSLPTPLALFVDEIDAVRSLPFSADEFFAGIRECYNRRAQEPVFERLVFCLIGVATPADLIQDARTTPFNIGARIELRDFTPQEAVPLAYGLTLSPSSPLTPPSLRLLRRALYWTSGHPYMTQRLCRAAAEILAQRTPDQAGEPDGESLVDSLCERLFLSKAAQESDDNLAFARNHLLKSEADLPSLMDLYQQVREGRRVRDDETNPLCGILRLSGIVAVERGHLKLRNRIYDRVFDRAWARTHMPDAELRRQKRAYRRGLMRAATVGGVVSLVMAVLTGVAIRAQEDALTHKDLLAIEDFHLKNLNEKLRKANTLLKGYTLDIRNKEAAALNSAEKERRSAQQANNAFRELKRSQKTLQDTAQEAVKLRMKAETNLESEQKAETNEMVQRHAADHARYVSDVQLAGQSWHDGNAAKALHLLRAHIPELKQRRDKQDQREFSWRYLWGLIHDKEVTTMGVPNSVPLIGAITPDDKLLNINGQAQWMLWNPQNQKVEQSFSLPSLDPQHCYLFSPDGRLLAMRDDKGWLTLLDAQTRQPLWELASTSALNSWAFAPDSHWLLVIGQDGTARVLNAVSGISKATISGQSDVRDAALSAGGNVMLIERNKPDTRVMALSTAISGSSATPPHRLAMWGQTISALACSPDGALFAAGDYGGRIKIWDALTYKVKCEYITPGRFQVRNLAFSPDSETLAIARQDNHILLYDIASQKVARTLTGHTAPVNFVSWSAAGDNLLTGGQDGTLRLWKVALPPTAQRLAEQFYPAPVVLSRDGHLLAAITMSNDITLWDMRSEKKIGTIPTYGQTPWSMAFTPNGRALAVGAHNRMVYLTDVKTQRLLHIFPELNVPELRASQYVVTTLAFSPDARWLAAGVGTPFHDGLDRGRALIWDMKSPEKPFVLFDCAFAVSDMRFSPDCKLLAAGGHDNKVRLWRVGSWKQPYQTLDVPDVSDPDHSLALAFAPHSDLLAVGGHNGPIALYAMPAGTQKSLLIGHSGRVRSLAFAPDGLTLASGSDDATIMLWDVTSHRDLYTFTEHTDVVQSVAFTPQGDALVSSSWDHSARVWRAPQLASADDQDRRERQQETKIKDMRVSAQNRQLKQSVRKDLTIRKYLVEEAGLIKKRAEQQIQDWKSIQKQYVRQIPARPREATDAQIDLTAHYNGSLHHLWHDPADGLDPHLLDLNLGLQTLAGTRFDVRGVVQVWGRNMWPGAYPDKVSGILVGRVCQRLHFLHSTGWISPADAKVGAYVIHYADGQTVTAPLIYGDNIAEWTTGPMQLQHASVAWIGAADNRQLYHRFYQYVWENPRPSVQIASIDFVSGKQISAPFLVAVTADDLDTP